MLVITLNDPETRNSAGPEIEAELKAELDRLEADPDLRVLALTGAGNSYTSLEVTSLGVVPTSVVDRISSSA